MKTYTESVEKTARLLNICASLCEKSNFRPREISRKLNTCNNAFYDAVRIGLFTKLGRAKYKANKDSYTENDAKAVIEFHRISEKQRKSKLKNSNGTQRQQMVINLSPAFSQTIEQSIEQLKAAGYKIMAPVQDWREV
jgi:spore germination protein YaaH